MQLKAFLSILFGALISATSALATNDSAKRFDYSNHPNYQTNYHSYNNCWVGSDDRTVSKSPWLRELQNKMDDLLRTNSLDCSGIKRFSFDVAETGAISNIQTVPTGNDYGSGSFEATFASKIGHLASASGKVMQNNRVTIDCELLPGSHCIIRQRISLRNEKK